MSTHLEVRLRVHMRNMAHDNRFTECRGRGKSCAATTSWLCRMLLPRAASATLGPCQHRTERVLRAWVRRRCRSTIRCRCGCGLGFGTATRTLSSPPFAFFAGLYARFQYYCRDISDIAQEDNDPHPEYRRRMKRRTMVCLSSDPTGNVHPCGCSLNGVDCLPRQCTEI